MKLLIKSNAQGLEIEVPDEEIDAFLPNALKRNKRGE